MNLDASVGLSFNGDCEAAFTLYERLVKSAGVQPQ